MKKNHIIFLSRFIIISIFILPIFVFASDSNGTIDPSYKYGWGENLGWINFMASSSNIHVTDTALSGYAWSREYGWINLAPSTTTMVTNNCLGQLGGYAWSSNLGWINFTGASIDFSGKFAGIAGSSTAQTGRIKFDCTNCNVQTDWRQCALRPSPPQVIINSVTNIVPTITANITMTNEGTVAAEYTYEWCVVTAIDSVCGVGNNIFYASAAKFLNVAESFITNLNATVPNPGTYYFKLVAHWQDRRSTASILFTAQSGAGGTGGGGGGGGGGFIPPVVLNYYSADFNRDGFVDSTDFSILLYFWKTNPPFKNIYVDINKDGKVDSTDFSIMLSQWGKKM